MKPAVQVKCSNCQNVLRVPPDLGDASVKCKHCGYILQLKKKAAPPPPPPATRPPVTQPAASRTAPPQTVARSPMPSTPMAPATRPAPASAMPIALDSLPEFIPTAPPPYPTAPSTTFPTAAPARNYPAAASPMPLDAESSSDFNPAFEVAGHRHKGRGSYRGPRNSGLGKWIAVSVMFLIAGGVVAIAVFKKDEWFGSKPAGGTGNDQVNSNSKESNNPGTATDVNPGAIKIEGGKKPAAVVQTGPMPRRLLAINISNYLYLNPLQYGQNQVEKESERKDFFKAMDRLAQGWKIPKNQVYFVTDGPTENNKIDPSQIPLKTVIEGAIDKFLQTSRPQDRIMIVFSGHAMEKDGEAYLVPLEGEFEEIPSLIPLKPIYEKLAKCPAQEKLLVFDVCRFDPGRGVERPIFGPMTEGLEKAIHDCPEGVSVLTSCSAGQHSYEYEYWQASVPGLFRIEHYGSVFQSLIFTADLKKAALTKLTSPESPLPFEILLNYLTEFVPLAVKDLEKKEQVPKFTSKARKEWLAYNKDEPLAPKFELPAAPKTAKREEVVAIFQELTLPDIKSAVKKVESNKKLADSIPFTEEALKDYMNTAGPSFEDIQKAPEKYEKDFPLRVATVEALLEMRKLVQDDPRKELPEEVRAPISDMFKARITNDFQRIITARQGVLEELKDKFDSAEKKREMEKSKRWLANFDFAYAQIKIRYAYIFEYNLALGKVKLEQLPERDEKIHRGWKLSSGEKMASPKEFRDMAEEGKTALTELMKAHPNTPWAMLAKSQRFMTLGLQWQPSSFGAE